MEARVQMTETKEELKKNKLVKINPGLLAKVTCISINGWVCHDMGIDVILKVSLNM